MLTLQQQTAVDAPANIHVALEAAAGSGKTTVLGERINKLVKQDGIDPANIVVATFSKSQSEDMARRIFEKFPYLKDTPLGDGLNGSSQVCTLHALARRMLVSYYPELRARGVAPDYTERKVIEAKIKELDWTISGKPVGWKSILVYINSFKRTVDEEGNLLPFLEGSLIEWAEGLVDYGSASYFAKVALYYQSELVKANLWTFADMLRECELRLKKDTEFRAHWQKRFTHVLVDEAQDTNAQNMRILYLLNPQSIFIVGDADQCVLGGEKVSTPRGDEYIDLVKENTEIYSAKKGQLIIKPVQRVSARHYSGTALKIYTASGNSVMLTPDHLVWGVLPELRQEKYKKTLHFVYLMFRRDKGFRIGYSRNPLTRIIGEKADRLWIIGSYPTEFDARFEEECLSLAYQIPTQVFISRGQDSLGQRYIDKLYQSIPTSENAYRLLSDHCLSFDTPHRVRAGNTQGKNARVVVYCTLFHRDSHQDKGHLISVETRNPSFWSKVSTYCQEQGLTITKAKRGARVRRMTRDAWTALTVAERLAQYGDAELQVKAVLWNTKEDVAGHYSLIAHRFTAGSLVPGMYIAEKQGEEIKPVEITKIEKQEVVDIPVFDLGIRESANFIVNNIVVHNCIYRFQGAKPEANLRQGFDDRYGHNGQRFWMTLNFRSQPIILERANRLIHQNYNPDNERYMKTLECGAGGAGPDLTWDWFEDVNEEARHVVNQIGERIELGELKPGQVMIMGRLNAQNAAIEIELLRKKLPFVNLGSMSFFDQGIARIIVAYLSASLDRSDWESFKAVYNVASCRMKTKSGEYCSTRWLGNEFLDKLQGETDLVAAAVRHQFDKDARGWARWERGIQDLKDTFRLIGEFTEQDNAQAAIQMLFGEILKAWIDDQYGVETDVSDSVRDDLDVILYLAKDFTVGEFLQYAKQLHKVKGVRPEEMVDYILIGTIYKFKGLERDCVYILGLSEGILPHAYAIGKASPKTDGLPIPQTTGLWDERNVAFVAVTRARTECHCSGIETWPSAKEALVPSRFVEEMGLIEIKENDDVEA